MSLNNQNSAKQSTEERRKWIEEKLNDIFSNPDKSDIFSLDLEINMLICSAQSYKHETVLKPFPSTFLSDSNNDKNYDGLLNALLTMPPLSQWRTKIKGFNEDQLALIHWLLVHKNYNLKLVTDINMEKLKEMANFHEQVANPTHIFEINYSEEKNKKFESLKQQTETELNSENSMNKSVVSTNFHGTRMDNLYSIMHIGLLSHFSKVSAYFSWF
jgi:poly[ADP-ribose] polymerase 16